MRRGFCRAVKLQNNLQGVQLAKWILHWLIQLYPGKAINVFWNFTSGEDWDRKDFSEALEIIRMDELNQFRR